MYFVYILKSLKDGSRYVGLTHDLKNRLQEHNAALSTYTKGHMPWKIVWYSVFSNNTKAKKFECYLKSGSGIAFMTKRLV